MGRRVETIWVHGLSVCISRLCRSSSSNRFTYKTVWSCPGSRRVRGPGGGPRLNRNEGSAVKRQIDGGQRRS